MVNKDKTLKVKIPAGIEDDTRMRIPGAGEAGSRGGENGDLYVFITVKPHKIFSREGANLYMRVPVSMACAALGGKLEIPAIDGSTIELSVPAGTQSDQIQKIGGEGMTVIRAKGRGDLFVKYRVETPVNLSTKQKELLEQFREISKDDSCQPETKGFLTKSRIYSTKLPDFNVFLYQTAAPAAVLLLFLSKSMILMKVLRKIIVDR